MKISIDSVIQMYYISNTYLTLNKIDGYELHKLGFCTEISIWKR